MALVPGANFGAYRILRPLGEGGMASVVLAFQPSLRREVAIKVIGAHLAADAGFQARFRREAEVLASLEHPNILPIYEFGEQDGQAYITYRYVPGGTLKDLLGAPLPASEVVRLLAPVAAALDFAHSRGVVHRDIKPSNILLTEDRTPIVADFGLAHLLQGGLRDGEAAVDLTQASVALGTPAYMAPEQVLGERLDGRADEYALGIIAYQMLTGSVPFVAETPLAVALKHLHEPLPLPSTRNPAVSPAVEQVLLVALAKAQGERYPSCGTFIAALAQAAQAPGDLSAATWAYTPASLPATADGSAAVATTPRSHRWRGLLLAGTGAALLLAIALVATFALRGGGKQPAPDLSSAATIAATANVPLGSRRTVFDGRLAPGWRDKTDPTEARVELASSLLHGGHAAAKVTTLKGYSGLRLAIAGLAPQGFTHLRLYFRGETAEAEPTGAAGLGSSAASASVEFDSSAVLRSQERGGWLRVDIPLFWLNTGGAPLTELVVQSNREEPTTFYVADIAFVALPPPPTPAPAQTGGVRFQARAGAKPVPGATILLGDGRRGVTDANGELTFMGVAAGRLDYKATLPDAFEGSPLLKDDSDHTVVKAGATVDAPVRAVKSDLKLLSPLNDAPVTTPVTLRWQAYPGAASYEVVIDGPGSPASDARTSETSLTLSFPLQPHATYDWLVNAYDAAGAWIANGGGGSFRAP